MYGPACVKCVLMHHHDVASPPAAAPRRWGCGCCMGLQDLARSRHTTGRRQLVSAVLDHTCVDEPPYERPDTIAPGPPASPTVSGKLWSEMHISDGRMRLFACLCPFRLDLSTELL